MEISSEKVREARMARGWTQQQLAEIANLSLRTVQRVENQSVASNETVSALSAVLEIPRTELMTLNANQLGQTEAERSMGRLLAAMVLLGAALGSGITVFFMVWLGGS
ncbi:MAG: helix-turn-helix domain-containing protein [Gammaproteobacteria bacterium]|nr:helix-turn-helix domain-containing protein [Gammaproteobacteria bacterium]